MGIIINKGSLRAPFLFKIMEKEFIPYKQALALKKLGFDEPCLGCYYKDKTFAYHPDSDVFANAPTFSQAFRWFREKYKIECYVNCYWSEEDSSKRTYYANYNYGSDIFFTIKTEFSSYEEAELECLKKLIEICGLK
jgi:hypothetical protein